MAEKQKKILGLVIGQVKRESCYICLTASVAQRDMSSPDTPGKCVEDRLSLEETKGSWLQATSSCVWSSLSSSFLKLVSQARRFPFHSTNRFQYAAHRGEELAISPMERKGTGL